MGPFDDREEHGGGCLCGAIRYTTTGDPVRVTICHCTFCQRLTGSAFLVEPIFRREDVEVCGEPAIHERKSDGSGRAVRVNFCARCGTTLFLSFDRFPDILGLCGGSFDDPNWFSHVERRHIFTRSAQAGVVLPAGVPIYEEHALQLDGAHNDHSLLRAPKLVTR